MNHSTAVVFPALLPRGVHDADYLLGGRRVLQAIDRHGNCRKRVKLMPDVDEEIVRVWLEGLLERLDPPPLVLMPSGPKTISNARIIEIATALRVSASRSRLQVSGER